MHAVNMESEQVDYFAAVKQLIEGVQATGAIFDGFMPDATPQQLSDPAVFFRRLLADIRELGVKASNVLSLSTQFNVLGDAAVDRTVLLQFPAREGFSEYDRMMAVSAEKLFATDDGIVVDFNDFRTMGSDSGCDMVLVWAQLDFTETVFPTSYRAELHEVDADGEKTLKWSTVVRSHCRDWAIEAARKQLPADMAAAWLDVVRLPIQRFTVYVQAAADDSEDTWSVYVHSLNDVIYGLKTLFGDLDRLHAVRVQSVNGQLYELRDGEFHVIKDDASSGDPSCLDTQ